MKPLVFGLPGNEALSCALVRALGAGRARMARSVPGYVAPGSGQVVELAHAYRWNKERGVALSMPQQQLDARKALLGMGFMHLNGADSAAEVTATVVDSFVLLAPFPMFGQGVGSSLFAHAFLETFGPL